MSQESTHANPVGLPQLDQSQLQNYHIVSSFSQKNLNSTQQQNQSERQSSTPSQKKIQQGYNNSQGTASSISKQCQKASNINNNIQDSIIEIPRLQIVELSELKINYQQFSLKYPLVLDYQKQLYQLINSDLFKKKSDLVRIQDIFLSEDNQQFTESIFWTVLSMKFQQLILVQKEAEIIKKALVKQLCKTYIQIFSNIKQYRDKLINTIIFGNCYLVNQLYYLMFQSNKQHFNLRFLYDSIHIVIWMTTGLFVSDSCITVNLERIFSNNKFFDYRREDERLQKILHMQEQQRKQQEEQMQHNKFLNFQLHFPEIDKDDFEEQEFQQNLSMKLYPKGHKRYNSCQHLRTVNQLQNNQEQCIEQASQKGSQRKIYPHQHLNSSNNSSVADLHKQINESQSTQANEKIYDKMLNKEQKQLIGQNQSVIIQNNQPRVSQSRQNTVRHRKALSEEIQKQRIIDNGDDGNDKKKIIQPIQECEENSFEQIKLVSDNSSSNKDWKTQNKLKFNQLNSKSNENFNTLKFSSSPSQEMQMKVKSLQFNCAGISPPISKVMENKLYHPSAGKRNIQYNLQKSFTRKNFHKALQYIQKQRQKDDEEEITKQQTQQKKHTLLEQLDLQLNKQEEQKLQENKVTKQYLKQQIEVGCILRNTSNINKGSLSQRSIDHQAGFLIQNCSNKSMQKTSTNLSSSGLFTGDFSQANIEKSFQNQQQSKQANINVVNMQHQQQLNTIDFQQLLKQMQKRQQQNENAEQLSQKELSIHQLLKQRMIFIQKNILKKKYSNINKKQEDTKDGSHLSDKLKLQQSQKIEKETQTNFPMDPIDESNQNSNTKNRVNFWMQRQNTTALMQEDEPSLSSPRIQAKIIKQKSKEQFNAEQSSSLLKGNPVDNSHIISYANSHQKKSVIIKNNSTSNLTYGEDNCSKFFTTNNNANISKIASILEQQIDSQESDLEIQSAALSKKKYQRQNRVNIQTKYGKRHQSMLNFKLYTDESQSKSRTIEYQILEKGQIQDNQYDEDEDEQDKFVFGCAQEEELFQMKPKFNIQQQNKRKMLEKQFQNYQKEQESRKTEKEDYINLYQSILSKNNEKSHKFQKLTELKQYKNQLGYFGNLTDKSSQ